MNVSRRSIFILPALLFPFFSEAQPFADKLKGFINTASLTAIQYPKEVKEFYQLNGYAYSWLAEQNNPNLRLLVNNIQSCAALGLEAQDYQHELFKAYVSIRFFPASENDSLLSEIKFTDAALHFLQDVQTGHGAESLSFNGLKYVPSCTSMASLLNEYLISGKFHLLPADIESRQPEYLAVKRLLNQLQERTSEEGFTDAIVTLEKKPGVNKALLTRLYQLGILNHDEMHSEGKALKEKLKEAQQLFSLLNDGELRSTTAEALNVPLSVRIAELKNTLNALRRLACIKQQRVVIVNIPSANLLVYEYGKVVMESRIIAGKKETPTPTLSGAITEVILYPYWNVPYKIATKELLPAIRRNPGYLEANNYQVLNRNGKPMDAKKINWDALGADHFPYTIRQSTGCDNALGLIKFNFYNPFSVYLHDTPGKNLFLLSRRYFSHGCMRLEKAMELGRYVLKDNRIAIDTLTEKGCLKNQAPIPVRAVENIPLFVLYHTAWADSVSAVRFYPDVYNKRPAPER